MLEKRHPLTMPAFWGSPREVLDVKHSLIDIFQYKILVSYTQVSKTVKNMYTRAAFKCKVLTRGCPAESKLGATCYIVVSLEQ